MTGIKDILRRLKRSTGNFWSTGSSISKEMGKKRRKRSSKNSKHVPPPDDGALRLNLGSGDKNLPGYTNIDIAASRKGTVPNVICDTRALAFPDASVDEILSIHAIEHFYHWEVPALLAEWKRVLRPGGRLVLECPNLLYAARQLVENPSLAGAGGKGWATTMFVFYGDPGWKDPLMCHRWGWTPESLIQCLETAGFSAVREEIALFKKGPPRDMRVIAEKPE